MAGTATLNPLEDFSSTLEPRILALTQIEPRLNIESNLPVDQIIPELATFRGLSGIAQLIYYAFNKTAIRTAIEYETLLEFNSQAMFLNMGTDATYSEYDKALRDIFITPPTDVLPYLSSLTKGQFLSRQHALEQQLSSIDLPNKPLLIRNFFIQLKDDIQQYRDEKVFTPEAKFGLLLQYHIDEVFDLKLPQPHSITLRPLPKPTRVPEHLLNLPSSGHLSDFAEIEVSSTADNEDDEITHIVADTAMPVRTLPPVFQKKTPIHHVYHFTFFHWNIMSGLNAKLTQDYALLLGAVKQHQQNQRTMNSKLMVAKRRADHFFADWYTKMVEGFQGIIHDANQRKEEALKQGSSSKGAFDTMATAFTDVIHAAMSGNDDKSMVSSISINLLPSFLSNRYTNYAISNDRPPVTPPPAAVVTPPPPPTAPPSSGWLPSYFSAAPKITPVDDVFTLRDNTALEKNSPEQEKKGWFW